MILEHWMSLPFFRIPLKINSMRWQLSSTYPSHTCFLRFPTPQEDRVLRGGPRNAWKQQESNDGNETGIGHHFCFKKTIWLFWMFKYYAPGVVMSSIDHFVGAYNCTKCMSRALDQSWWITPRKYVPHFFNCDIYEWTAKREYGSVLFCFLSASRRDYYFKQQDVIGEFRTQLHLDLDLLIIQS